ncbi:amino acid permease [bacterium]|nr:amino acid permease [bacterium]
MDRTGLDRQLGLFDSIMMMMGIVIGSGIFLTTGIMAQTTPSASMILLVWLVGGLLTLAGALTFAELGAAMPEAGGHYVYLREAYGRLPAFLFGWILFLVAMGGSIAALGVALVEYLSYFFATVSTSNYLLSVPISLLDRSYVYTLSAGQLVAVVFILGLSGINYVGVTFGKAVQNVFTVVKIGTIIIFIVVGLAVETQASIDIALNPTGLSLGELITGFGLALVAVSWAFDGWNNISYVAGEIKDPGRNLPRSLILGTAAITLLYMVVNYIYLRALSIDEMSGVVRIAEKASSSLFGPNSASLISVAVMISVFGALNGSIFVGARVYYAMARDRVFFQNVASVHPRFRTPGVAIIAQAAWASILTVSGTFEQLFTYVIFISLIFWTAAVASVFTLRKKNPHWERPYKTWGYPAVPVLFIVATIGIILNTLIERPVESSVGLAIAFLGIPVYFYWNKKGSTF